MQQVLRCPDFLRCPGIKTLDFPGPLQCANSLEHRIWHVSGVISCKKLQVYESLSYVSIRQHTSAYLMNAEYGIQVGSKVATLRTSVTNARYRFLWDPSKLGKIGTA